MTTAHQLRLYTRTGTLTHVLTDFLSLAYARRVNEVGFCQFTISGSHSAVASLDPDAAPVVEVWRKDYASASDWRCDFAGRIRYRQQRTDANGIDSCTLRAVDGIGLLALCTVAYTAQTASRNTWTATPAETIAKQIVTYNATSAGTVADGREVAVSLSGVTVEADAAGGSTITTSCAWQNVLAALRGITAVGNGDFDMIRTAPAVWEFRWYSSQRGTDRSTTVVFALNYGNMAQPQLTEDHTNEPTVAIVGGQGVEGARTVAIVTGPNFALDANAAEIFINASHLSDATELIAVGAARLNAERAVEDIQFEALQTPGSRYAEHYDLGDLVAVRYLTYSAIKQITAITVEVTGDGESITIDTSAISTVYHIAAAQAVTVTDSVVGVSVV